MALTQEWYEVRACQMEEKSRLVDNALELIKLAIQHGFDVSGNQTVMIKQSNFYTLLSIWAASIIICLAGSTL